MKVGLMADSTVESKEVLKVGHWADLSAGHWAAHSVGRMAVLKVVPWVDL